MNRVVYNNIFFHRNKMCNSFVDRFKAVSFTFVVTIVFRCMNFPRFQPDDNMQLFSALLSVGEHTLS